MKYLLVLLLLAAIAAVEYSHVLSSEDAPGGAMCTAQDGKGEAIRDAALSHLRSH